MQLLILLLVLAILSLPLYGEIPLLVIYAITILFYFVITYPVKITEPFLNKWGLNCNHQDALGSIFGILFSVLLWAVLGIIFLLIKYI